MRQKTRAAKIKSNTTVVHKEKFIPTPVEGSVQPNIPRLDAKNDNQKLALKYLRDRQVVFLTGSAGTGKSLLAAYHCATLLKQKRVDKVLLLRPAVAVGKSVGLLPGTLDEKLLPYFAQTIDHMKKFMGGGHTQYCLERKVIELGAVEYTRGRSFENIVVIVEESQNLTQEEFEMILTRIGEGSQLIFTGDTKQHDLKGKSGLDSTLALIDKMLETSPRYLSDDDLDQLDQNIGVVRFGVDDVLRGGLTKAFVKMYYNT